MLFHSIYQGQLWRGLTNRIFRSSYGSYHECELQSWLSPRCIFAISRVLVPRQLFFLFIVLNVQNVSWSLKNISWRPAINAYNSISTITVLGYIRCSLQWTCVHLHHSTHTGLFHNWIANGGQLFILLMVICDYTFTIPLMHTFNHQPQV